MDVFCVNGMRLRAEASLWLSRYSDVYKVIDDSTQEEYVLKTIKIPDAGNKNRLEKLGNWVMAEQDMVRSLPTDHPNIMRFFYAGIGMAKNEMVYFILSEFCPRTIEDLKGRELSEKRLLQMFRDVLMGLLYLHSRSPPVAHRHVVSKYIFIGKDGAIKLGHFRSCTTVHRAYHSAEEIRAATKQFEHNTVLKSRAPEQIVLCRGHVISEKVDIWALGLLLLEFALGSSFKDFGSEVYAAVDMEERIDRLLNHLNPMLEEIAEDSRYSSGLSVIIGRCLEIDPARRASAVELVHLCQRMNTEGELPEWPGSNAGPQLPSISSKSGVSVDSGSTAPTVSTVSPSHLKANSGDNTVCVSKFAKQENDHSHQNGHSVVSQSTAGPTESPGVAEVVLEAARALGESSGIPGVSEAATLLSIMVKLFMDERSMAHTMEKRVRMCRSILVVLQRAEEVLGQAKGAPGEAEAFLLEEVRISVDDLLQIMQAYRSKNKIKRILISSLFKRRQEEAEMAIDRAMSRLQFVLQVHVGKDVKDAVKHHPSSAEVTSNSLLLDRGADPLKLRRIRRQRRLDEIEIPQDKLVLTDEVLGEGGFGKVVICDFYGRNAAAKILPISRDFDYVHEDTYDDEVDEKARADAEEDQRRRFFRELETMTRLRSPHTVQVYGAVTSWKDKFVIVMELLVGGDLRTFLKATKEPLIDNRARQIVGDVCAGMAVLHGKDTIHGDLKSANVLLDGAGRAKITDFGASRWTQQSTATGLATYNTSPAQKTFMSVLWAAPEVLSSGRSSFASDVYSFGMVVWEVLSREIPWAGVSHEDLYRRIVIAGDRPVMPIDAPRDLAETALACWARSPGKRPTFSDILEGMKACGWQDA